MATVVAWNLNCQSAPAQDASDNSTNRYDINEETGKCGGHSLENVPGESDDYFESYGYALPIPGNFVSHDPYCALFFKLKAWYDPVVAKTHPNIATITFVGELYGRFPNGDNVIILQSAKHEFKGDCDASNGLITYSLTQVAEPAPNSGATGWAEDPEDERWWYKAIIYINDFEMTPETGESSSVKLTAKLNVRWDSNLLGVEVIQEGPVQEKQIEFTMKSHLHP